MIFVNNNSLKDAKFYWFLKVQQITLLNKRNIDIPEQVTTMINNRCSNIQYLSQKFSKEEDIYGCIPLGV
ncbi:hypothetical protein C922_05327 [Plasmodium inui San Antonio 1]|uniref:Uncharacterized protein n=1 Tax=Plasmodium inui San Antonio 1 TaxID=1237626 RepID=W6ZYC6_9APIC|nr:hypothetical protein C922_05327 [Plasmodium inui San Antonio 1]EUD64295.1 hypothetical protein C922_05327 [Plasmodium inui San Antonio 1]